MIDPANLAETHKYQNKSDPFAQLYDLHAMSMTGGGKSRIPIQMYAHNRLIYCATSVL